MSHIHECGVVHRYESFHSILFSKLIDTFITFILLSEWRGKKRNTGSFFFLRKHSRYYNVDLINTPLPHPTLFMSDEK